MLRVAARLHAIDVLAHDTGGPEYFVGGRNPGGQQGEKRPDLAVVSLARHDRFEGGGGLLGGERAAGEQDLQGRGQLGGPRQSRVLRRGGGCAVGAHQDARFRILWKRTGMMNFLAEAYLHSLDPFAIKFPAGWPLEGIRWYGLAYLAGFLVAWLMVRWLARTHRTALPVGAVADVVLYVLVGVLVGGRLGYCVFYRPELLVEFTTTFPFWGLLAINNGGMASHGGMIGGLLASLYYARCARDGRHSLPHLIDLIAFAAPLGLFFGRIANFVNGELIGRPCSPTLPWAVKFPQEMFDWDHHQLVALQNTTAMYLPSPTTWAYSIEYLIPRFIEQIQNGNVALIRLIEPLLTSRHPSQIYQAVLEGLVLFVILAMVWTKPRKPGVIGGCFCIAYGFLRIIGEFYRQPDAHLGLQWLSLTRGQWLSVILILVGIVLIPLFIRRDTQPMGGWIKAKDASLLSDIK